MQFSLFASIYTVSQVVRRLRELIESDHVLGDIWIQGEVSNFVRHNSGHLYFSLKDERAAVRCVMWKSDAARQRRLPSEGQAVYAHGRFSVYDVRGEVQFYVEEIELLGAGTLWQQFEERKQRLEKEGLFDPGRKRALPKFPRCIGIVTSRDGAVLHDIRRVLTGRYPLPQVYLAHCAVQGTEAPLQIVAALRALERVADLDVIILARGGGSIEDLWAFNDERVARAIVATRVPVVSGVGHETDFTIADFCADVRAPTPTAAAQCCTPDQAELRATLRQQRQRLVRALREAVRAERKQLVQHRAALERVSPRARIANQRQQLDDLLRSGLTALRKQVQLQREQLRGAQRHLEALNPQATLDRGYAIVLKQSAVVSTKGQVQPQDQLAVRVRDGEFTVRVE